MQHLCGSCWNSLIDITGIISIKGLKFAGSKHYVSWILGTVPAKLRSRHRSAPLTPPSLARRNLEIPHNRFEFHAFWSFAVWPVVYFFPGCCHLWAVRVLQDDASWAHKDAPAQEWFCAAYACVSTYCNASTNSSTVTSPFATSTPNWVIIQSGRSMSW